MKNKTIYAFLLLVPVVTGAWAFKNINANTQHTVGQILNEFNGVSVYYNGAVNHVLERNTTTDGYNLGLKYQCVEFVKRYYYEHLNHKMPDSYGHAKAFFNDQLKDGAMNIQRNLIQYNNASKSKPQVNDLIIFDGHLGNRYGHVAIIAKVTNSTIEIIQQNSGPFASTRATYPLTNEKGVWTITHKQLLGWLRKE